jgi:hypothetical protein
MDFLFAMHVTLLVYHPIAFDREIIVSSQHHYMYVANDIL